MNPEKLSLLSDQELSLLAERIGIYIPEGLDRPFVIEEIVAALEDDYGERVFSHDGTGHVEEKKLSGPSYVPFTSHALKGIPERYNETMIRVLPRDPAWIYAYWDIAEHKRNALAEEGLDESLFLRVSEINSHHDHKRDFFDIPITLDDWKWYINIPQPGSRYRVDLCSARIDKTKVLAKSNEVRMPLYHMVNMKRAPQITKSLLILSGLEGLHIAEPREENPARILVADEE
ncbi:MAG: hypothetical protein FD137_2516 [Spirochaetes bacterium]|nr:MAG: hypothetical protein FD137_2516 [Spirochaetota bacterium]